MKTVKSKQSGFEDVTLPLKIPFFRLKDLSSVSDEKLALYQEALNELSYQIDTESEATVDVWKVLSRLSAQLRSEMYSRRQKSHERKKNLEKRRKAGLVPNIKKHKTVKPFRAKRKI